MKIEMIDSLHLKVELTDDDMHRLEINRASFLSRSERSKIVLKNILKNAHEQTGFDIFNSKLLIEIFPLSGDGCLMMFTKSPERKKRKLKITSPKKNSVFEFTDTTQLLDCANSLITQNIPSNNALFCIDKKFYLYIPNAFCNLKGAMLVLSEFNAKKSDISKEYLIEHGVCVIKNDAINTLCSKSSC